MKDNSESQEYRAFESTEELQWFLAQNEKFVDLLAELKLKISEKGMLRVTPAAGCPMIGSKCIPLPSFGPNQGDPPPFRGVIVPEK